MKVDQGPEIRHTGHRRGRGSKTKVPRAKGACPLSTAARGLYTGTEECPWPLNLRAVTRRRLNYCSLRSRLAPPRSDWLGEPLPQPGPGPWCRSHTWRKQVRQSTDNGALSKFAHSEPAPHHYSNMKPRQPDYPSCFEGACDGPSCLPSGRLATTI